MNTHRGLQDVLPGIALSDHGVRQHRAIRDVHGRDVGCKPVAHEERRVRLFVLEQLLRGSHKSDVATMGAQLRSATRSQCPELLLPECPGSGIVLLVPNLEVGDVEAYRTGRLSQDLVLDPRGRVLPEGELSLFFPLILDERLETVPVADPHRSTQRLDLTLPGFHMASFKGKHPAHVCAAT
jgi:hypothetical protein